MPRSVLARSFSAIDFVCNGGQCDFHGLLYLWREKWIGGFLLVFECTHKHILCLFCVIRPSFIDFYLSLDKLLKSR
jgi:hypothetical protein